MLHNLNRFFHPILWPCSLLSLIHIPWAPCLRVCFCWLFMGFSAFQISYPKSSRLFRRLATLPEVMFPSPLLGSPFFLNGLRPCKPTRTHALSLWPPSLVPPYALCRQYCKSASSTRYLNIVLCFLICVKVGCWHWREHYTVALFGGWVGIQWTLTSLLSVLCAIDRKTDRRHHSTAHTHHR